MKINLSQYAGFCDGVRRAYYMVASFDVSRAKQPVFILGSLAHNSEVIRKIEEKGIQRIELAKIINSQPGEIGTVIVTAHGSEPDVYRIAKEKGIDIFDATCPKVVRAQRLAQVFFKRGYQIVLVGDKDHKEVRGIDGWGGGRAIIISQEADLGETDFSKFQKIAVLSQTTQDEDFFVKIAAEIKRRYSGKKVEIISTICNTTRERQKEVKRLARDNEVVLIIGSKNSANSGRLAEISGAINHRSYFVENALEIKRKWLEGIETVGISAGASTPPWVIEDVVNFLEKL